MYTYIIHVYILCIQNTCILYILCILYNLTYEAKIKCIYDFVNPELQVTVSRKVEFVKQPILKKLCIQKKG